VPAELERIDGAKQSEAKTTSAKKPATKKK